MCPYRTSTPLSAEQKEIVVAKATQLKKRSGVTTQSTTTQRVIGSANRLLDECTYLQHIYILEKSQTPGRNYFVKDLGNRYQLGQCHFQPCRNQNETVSDELLTDLAIGLPNSFILLQTNRVTYREIERTRPPLNTGPIREFFVEKDQPESEEEIFETPADLGPHHSPEPIEVDPPAETKGNQGNQGPVEPEQAPVKPETPKAPEQPNLPEGEAPEPGEPGSPIAVDDMATPRELRIATPSDFDGNPASFAGWMHEVKDYLSINATVYDTDKKKIVFTLATMKTGNAFVWKQGFRRNIPTTAAGETWPTWVECWTKLETHFVRENLRSDALLQLRTMTQGKRTIQEFNNEFRLVLQMSKNPTGGDTDYLLIGLYQSAINQRIAQTIKDCKTDPTTTMDHHHPSKVASPKFDASLLP